MPGPKSILDYLSAELIKRLSPEALSRLAGVPVTIDPTAPNAGSYYPAQNKIVFRTDKLASNVRDLVFGHEATHAADPSRNNPKAADWFVKSMPQDLLRGAQTAYGPMQTNFEYYPEILQNAGFNPATLPYDVRRHYSAMFTPDALGIVPRRLIAQAHAAPNDTRMTSPVRRMEIVKSNKPLMPPKVNPKLAPPPPRRLRRLGGV